MSERPLWRLVAGRKTGPYLPEKLRPLMKDGRICSLDRFSYDGTDWRPPTEFPELLRPSAPVVVTQQRAEVAVDPLEGDLQSGIDWPDQGGASGGFTPAADDVVDDAATKKLLAMINGLIWVGVGVVVILVTLMIITTVFYKPAIGTPAPVAQPKKPPAATSTSAAGDAAVSEPVAKERAAEPADAPPPTADGKPASDGERAGSDEPARSTAASPGSERPTESDPTPAKPRVPVLP